MLHFLVLGTGTVFRIRFRFRFQSLQMNTVPTGSGSGSATQVRALVKLLGWSPVEALQFQSTTQSHWSSGSTICFLSRGSAVRVLGMQKLTMEPGFSCQRCLATATLLTKISLFFFFQFTPFSDCCHLAIFSPLLTWAGVPSPGREAYFSTYTICRYAYRWLQVLHFLPFSCLSPTIEY